MFLLVDNEPIDDAARVRSVARQDLRSKTATERSAV